MSYGFEGTRNRSEKTKRFSWMGPGGTVVTDEVIGIQRGEPPGENIRTKKERQAVVADARALLDDIYKTRKKRDASPGRTDEKEEQGEEEGSKGQEEDPASATTTTEDSNATGGGEEGNAGDASISNHKEHDNTTAESDNADTKNQEGEEANNKDSNNDNENAGTS